MKPLHKTAKHAVRRVFSAVAAATLMLALVSACTQPSPRKYIERTVLNANQVTGFYRKLYFEELQPGSAVEHVQQFNIVLLDQGIERVKGLKVTDETKPLIDASLDVLEYGKKVFETEYISIARQIDEGKPQAEIDSAIARMFNTHDAAIGEKLNKLEAVAMPYAEKHGVDLQFR